MKYRIWWTPDAPGRAFTMDYKSEDAVAAVTRAVQILDALAYYDEFLREHGLLGFHSNVGGLQVWDEGGDENGPGWTGWRDEDSGIDDPEYWLDMQAGGGGA